MNEPWTKDSTPLFSVLIANYNNGQYLEECLQSVFAQSYTNWEIIIVDDGSTDIVSKEIYDKIKDKPKVRIFFNERNMGCGFAKRKCVEKAKGEFCAFLDPDDILTSDALETIMSHYITCPLHSIIYSTHFVCDNQLQIKATANYVGQIPIGDSHLSFDGPRISQFATFKKTNYLRTDGINPSLKRAVDQDLYLKLEETGPILFIGKPLYYYRHQSNSISLGDKKYLAFKSEIKVMLDALRRRNFKQKENVISKIEKGLIHHIYTEKGAKNLSNALNAYFLYLKITKKIFNFKLNLLVFKIILDWLFTKLLKDKNGN